MKWLQVTVTTSESKFYLPLLHAFKIFLIFKISINEVMVVGKIFTAISIITDINLNSKLKSCFA